MIYNKKIKTGYKDSWIIDKQTLLFGIASESIGVLSIKIQLSY